ncbi:MAG: PEGA domain-containing protein [Candidatus Uhrbacteria bacterium]|nr:PEGA domain-containing protein [Candidatus Uhrbacteria bacterium]
MHKPSFSRQVLFWVSAVMFLAIAPSVVFYTAGYRWNSKKGIIERNGTMIIDTIPVGAAITLNGERVAGKTPMTLKSVAPGTYHIQLDLQGWSSWQKTLDVRPELVTFVTQVHLWPISEPVLVTDGAYRAFRLSPSQRYAAAILEGEGKKSFAFFDASLSRTSAFVDLPVSATLSSVAHIDWSGDSSAVLVTLENGNAYLVTRRNADRVVELPQGQYRWERGILIGVLDGERYVYDVANDSITRDPLAGNIVDLQESLTIFFSTSTGAMSIVDDAKKDVAYGLPSGSWSFSESHDGYIFLRRHGELLSFDIEHGKPSAIRVPSDDTPKIMTSAKSTALLSRHEGEVWMTTVGKDPELLIRTSDPITDVEWYTSGRDVFFSTTKDLIALELDTRDSRIQTKLASFDAIYGIGIVKRELFIAGTRGQEQGIWRLAIE